MKHFNDICVTEIDENHLLYGNFIGLQYVFDEGLDSDVLAESVGVLVNQFPALSGYYSAKTQTVIAGKKRVALVVNKSSETLESSINNAERPDYVTQYPRNDVLRGRALLSTFSLTEFQCGGVIVGVAISHLLTDAAGFHRLMQHLGTIYTALISGDGTPSDVVPDFHFVTDLDVFKFGKGRTKADVLSALKQRGLPKPVPIKGLVGRLVKSLIVKAMDKSLTQNKPVIIKFSAEHIARLKQTVLSESGEDWISTNVALCAHFTRLVAKLSYGDDLQYDIQIGQLLDLRNRYFEGAPKEQSNFIGNAILIHIGKASFPKALQETSRGELARYFKRRQFETDAADVKTRLDLLSDCLRHGYTNPELDFKSPIISLNNQSKMPVYDVHFQGRSPRHIFPQDVGDNIMFFPTRDGGMSVHIRDIVNPGRQEVLHSSEWQSLIYDF